MLITLIQRKNSLNFQPRWKASDIGVLDITLYNYLNYVVIYYIII